VVSADLGQQVPGSGKRRPWNAGHRDCEKILHRTG
jgi:hypothetical protein